MRQTRLILFLPLLFALPVLAQDSYIYMTIHNLGCRQANHTYSGFLPNLGFSEGDLVQVILAGPNGHIDLPAADGMPGGDDQLAVNPGLPFAMNPVSFTHWPNTFYSPEAILIQRAGNGPEPALHIGSKFYVRAWNGPTPFQSDRYFDSDRLWQDFPVSSQESCNLDSSVRTIRHTVLLPAFITYAVYFDAGHTYVPPDALHLVSPNGGEIWTEDQSVEIQWETGSDISTVDLLLKRGLEGAWDTLASGIENDGSEMWTVTLPSNLACYVRVAAASDSSRFDDSDLPFIIQGIPSDPPLPPQIVADYGDPTHVTLCWSAIPDATSYQVEMSYDYYSWNAVTVTSDTTCIIPFTAEPDEFRLFRVISIR